MPSAGNVGVNTTAPEGRLHIVHASQDANGNALVLGPTTQSNLRLGYHQSYSWVQSHGSRPLALNPLGSRVGVGVSSPEGTLDVARGDGSGGTLQIRGTQRISHFNFSSDEHTYLRGGKRASNVYLNDTGGNVAIGSTDPQGNRLLVNGAAKVLGLLHVADGAIMPSAGNSGGAGILFPKDPGGGGGDAAWIRYYPRSGEATTLEIGTANDADDHIALMPTGNVGLGTTAPEAKLHVAGGAIVSTLQIGGTTIGEHELHILQRLAEGVLEFDLYNVGQDEYAYAADYAPYDGDRRRIFTWRPGGRVTHGRWRIYYPS